MTVSSPTDKKLVATVTAQRLRILRADMSAEYRESYVVYNSSAASFLPPTARGKIPQLHKQLINIFLIEE